MSLQEDAVNMLRETSRTFYLSIVHLPPRIQEAVMSAYLSLRAIDEIEDHPQLSRPTKTSLLRDISFSCQFFDTGGVDRLFSTLRPCREYLPEVTNRLGEWLALAPETIAPRIWDANSIMAQRMAYWVENNWEVHTKADLDCYTFSVAGAVGLLLSDLWAWYAGTPSHRGCAVGFGRGLQAVNILRNRAEDLNRGVNFFPDGWNEDDLRCYAKRNLTLAEAYLETLSPGPANDFCRLPLSLAHATLAALTHGDSKLSRSTVLDIVRQARSAPRKTEDAPGHNSSWRLQ
jgi:farnesyl-diphosphate farnesyltransferase